MKRFVEVRIWNGKTIWIGKKGDQYIAYQSHIDAFLGIASPALNHIYSQFSLENAYKTGILISDK